MNVKNRITNYIIMIIAINMSTTFTRITKSIIIIIIIIMNTFQHNPVSIACCQDKVYFM